MADLSTLDDTQPPDTEAVALGAQRIRETRSAILGSFGGEHYLGGQHAFQRGVTASRPAAGLVGHVYFNTDSDMFEIDDGAIWRMVHTTQVSTSGVGSSVNLSTVYQGIQSLVVAPPVGANMLFFGSGQLTQTSFSTPNDYIDFGMYVDGVLNTAAGTLRKHLFAASIADLAVDSYSIFGYAPAISNAFHTVQIRGKAFAGTSPITMTGAIMAVML